MFRGKKYKESAKLIDRAVQYEPAEALGLVVKGASAKFDETVELHIKLGVVVRLDRINDDTANQTVRTSILHLPHRSRALPIRLQNEVGNAVFLRDEVVLDLVQG